MVTFFYVMKIRPTAEDLTPSQAERGYWFVLCLPDEGLSDTGAAAEGRGD